MSKGASDSFVSHFLSCAHRTRFAPPLFGDCLVARVTPADSELGWVLLTPPSQGADLQTADSKFENNSLPAGSEQKLGLRIRFSSEAQILSPMHGSRGRSQISCPLFLSCAHTFTGESLVLVSKKVVTKDFHELCGVFGGSPRMKSWDRRSVRE